MATRPYTTFPQVQVQQNFQSTSASNSQPLLAVIVGPQINFQDVTNSADAANTSYGAYNTTANTPYALKGLGATDVLIPSSIDILLNSALASYANLSGTGNIALGSSQNSLTLVSGGFVEYLNADGSVAYARNGAFYGRDVAVGDGVIVSQSGSPILTSSVTSIVRALNAASLGTIAADVANLHSTGTDTITTVNAESTDHALVLDSSNAFAGNLASGYITDTYTITVISGGVGAASTLSISSVKGDNTASLANVAIGSALSVGSYGLVVHFSGTGAFVTGEQYTIAITAPFASQLPALVSGYTGANYVGSYNTVYEVQVVKGGTWAQGPQVAVTTNNGVDSSVPQTLTSSNKDFFLGSLGLKATFSGSSNLGLDLGDIFYVPVTAASNGAATTVKLADPLPSTITSGSTIAVDFCFNAGSVNIPSAGYPSPGSVAWTVSGNTVTLEDQIYIQNSAFADNDSNLLNLQVLSANVQIGYQALVVTSANQINTISDPSLIPAQLGSANPSNPLAYAVEKALENSNGQPVYYTPVASNDLAGYIAAFEATLSDPSVEYVVPLTNDETIIDAAVAAIDSASAVTQGRERAAIVNKGFSPIQKLYDINPNTGVAWTGYVSILSGVYTHVTVPGASFIADGVNAGDIFNSNFSINGLGQAVYQSVVIASVTDNQNLVLISPGFSAAIGSSSSPRQVQIVRNLSKDQQAANIAAASSAIGNRRVVNVWPNVLNDGAWTVPGYFAAAAIAGQASGLAPHQPMSNMILLGFSSVPMSTPYFSFTQLNVIAGGGTWIINQAPNNGEIYTRQQLTTDYTDDETAEFSVTRNVDAITKFLRSDLSAFAGKYNNSPYFLQLMNTRLAHDLTGLMKTIPNEAAGPQLINYTINGVTQDPLSVTGVDADIDINVPNVANVIKINLNIS